MLEIDSSGLMYLGNAKAAYCKISWEVLKILNPSG